MIDILGSICIAFTRGSSHRTDWLIEGKGKRHAGSFIFICADAYRYLVANVS